MTRNKEEIISIAVIHGYALREEQHEIGLLIFEHLIRGVQVNVYTTTMTVTTILTHPVKGHGQLYRRKVSMELLRQLFKNPRLHTGKGYSAKKNKLSISFLDP